MTSHDEELDGIPHAVIGLTVLVSVMLAIVVLLALSGGGQITVAAALLAIPVFVVALERKAERARDH
jgi:hypothetical protein